MWNHFLPPALKQYFDNILVTGRVFRYTACGPEGLLHDQQIVHVQSAGGVYDHTTNELDLGSKDINFMTHFMGLNAVKSVYIEGAYFDPTKKDTIVAQAMQAAKKLAEEL